MFVRILRHLCDSPDDCESDECWTWTAINIESGERIIGPDVNTSALAIATLSKYPLT